MTPGKAFSDRDVLAVLRELYEAGRRDDLGGGVHPSTLAYELDASPPNIYQRLNELEQAGDVVAVRGLHPESREPRTSYVPAEKVENPK